MKFEELKRQFQARHQEALQERDELSREAEGILKEYKPLVELSEILNVDLKAGKFRIFLQKLKDHGFNSLSEFEEKLDRFDGRIEDILIEHEKLEDELNRRIEICPDCAGIGYVRGKSEWVESDIGRICVPRRVLCSLCLGRREFDVRELLE